MRRPPRFCIGAADGLVDRLVVYPERMRDNLDSLGGLVDSQRVLLALTQAGMSREDAYPLVQGHAIAAWHGDGRFADRLKADPKSPASCRRRRSTDCSIPAIT